MFDKASSALITVLLFVGSFGASTVAIAAPMMLPNNLADLLQQLNLGKPPVSTSEPVGAVDTALAPDQEAVAEAAGVPIKLMQTTSPPDPMLPQFCLDSRSAGGTLVVLERPGVPIGGPKPNSSPGANDTNVTPPMVSDMLVFPPGGVCYLNQFSDPIGLTFQLTDPYNNNALVNNPATGNPYTFDELLTAGSRQVEFINEGFLIDPRCSGRLAAACNSAKVIAPFGNMPVSLQDAGILGVTIFITPRPNDCGPTMPLCGQAYVVFSDTVPEPGTLALLGVGLAGIGLWRRPQRRR